MNKYIKTIQLAALQKLNGGIAWLLPDAALKSATLVALLYLWRVALSSGVQTPISLEQMLTYTYLSALLGDLLVVQSPASGWLSDGVLLKLYGRPLSMLGQLAAETAGGWVPMLLLFSTPMAILSPLLGVSLMPSSWLFLPSLLLSVSLGFAVDALFACLCIKMRNMSWLVGRMRIAITAVFSGTIIPIRLLPFGLAEALKYQPFACLGGAVLSLYTGTADVRETLLLQILWNIILWPAALFVLHQSREGMVSYGG